MCACSFCASTHVTFPLNDDPLTPPYCQIANELPNSVRLPQSVVDAVNVTIPAEYDFTLELKTVEQWNRLQVGHVVFPRRYEDGAFQEGKRAGDVVLVVSALQSLAWLTT